MKKQSKTRITVLAGVNMSGTEKMSLLAIGKTLTPRAFKNLKKPPIKNSANKTAGEAERSI